MTEPDARPRRSRWTIALWLGVSVVLTAFVVLSWFALVRREGPIEAATVERIHVGMTQAELWETLGGAPDHEQLVFGRIEEPIGFTTNSFASRSDLAKRGFRDYRFQQWTTPRATVVVVSEPNGGVACRYSAEGQDANWFNRLWFVVSGKARRPPADDTNRTTTAP